MYKTTVLLLLVLSIICSHTKGQNIDSLHNILLKTEIDSLKINILLEIAEIQDENDSALYYAEEALKYAEVIENNKKIAEANMLLAYIYTDLDFNEKIIEYFNKAESYYTKTNNTSALSEIYKNIGRAYELSGDLGNAGKYYLKALKIIETIDNNNIELARILNNIGSVYFTQEQYDGALKYWNRALIKVKQLDYKKGISIILSNIGNVYLHKYDTSDSSTLHYITDAEVKYSEALQIAKESNDTSTIYLLYNNIGTLYQEKMNIKKALLYYKKALIIAKKENNTYNQVIVLSNIGDIFSDNKKYKKAIESLKEAEIIANKNKHYTLLENIFFNFSFAYSKLRNFEDAYFYNDKYVNLRDSLKNDDISKSFAKNENKYNYEKREKENEKLKITNQLQEEKNTKQRLFLIASIVGLLLLSFLAIAILRGYRQKRRANELLEKQKTQILDKNTELVHLNEEIGLQRDEIEAQRDLVSTQKNQIENIHTEVTHSIKYAQRIQTSILPNKTILDNNFTDSFVLFKPKDVVSGDFYWFTHSEEEDITIATAADCTGHGVPGAFMSMLGVSFLKEIVNKEYITNTGLILKKLRKEIINALQQKGETGEQKDGMDMALIAFNHKTKVLQFSGANNPVYIISDELNILSEGTEFKTFLDENNEKGKNLYEIKPDKMPIAIYLKMDRFKTHEIKLKEGDMVYMSSDGYADQFGGPKGKKLKYKPFKRLLLENSCKNLEFQHNQLDKYIENWKAYTDLDGEVYEQVDDICIVGLKI